MKWHTPQEVQELVSQGASESTAKAICFLDRMERKEIKDGGRHMFYYDLSCTDCGQGRELHTAQGARQWIEYWHFNHRCRAQYLGKCR